MEIVKQFYRIALLDEYYNLTAEEIERSAIEHSGMKPAKVRYRVEAFFALGG